MIIKIFFVYFNKVKGTKEAEELLKTIEEYGLGDKEFFGGEELGLTDIAYGWIACWLDVLAEAAGVEMLGPQSFPRLQAWAERFKQLPLIKDNLPDRHKMLTFFKSRREKIIAPAATS
ncbi:hypothetical protein Golob_017297 [Gossypium lobatum]|uniref:Glutathione S-transferase n=1 Tax=Gossypium lobatum TaxID=34289 RepID=A0A7J8M6U1_9ROSI|nr:hypothetical protein [Gossypium lobatum]